MNSYAIWQVTLYMEKEQEQENEFLLMWWGFGYDLRGRSNWWLFDKLLGALELGEVS